MSLIKTSERTLRHDCKKCGRSGSLLYVGENADGEQVLIDKTDETAMAKKGDEVSSSALHPCPFDYEPPGPPEPRATTVVIELSARVTVVPS